MGQRHLHSINGFTLTEVMIGVGILSISALAAMSLSADVMKSAATAQDSQEVTALQYEVDGILNNASMCTERMTNPQVTSASDADVTLGPNIRAGAKYGQLTINSVKLKSVAQVGSIATNFHADVAISGTKRKVYGTQDFTLTSGVYYSVDGANKVAKCMGADLGAASCGSLGGTWNGTQCDLCATLGGTIQPNGSCLMPNSAQASAPTGPQPPSPYYWDVGSWSACSNNAQSRTRQCLDISQGTVVAESSCYSPGPATTQACGGGPVNPNCKPSGWQYTPVVQLPDCFGTCYAGASATCLTQNGTGMPTCDPASVADMCQSMCGDPGQQMAAAMAALPSPTQNAQCCSGMASRVPASQNFQCN